MLKTSRVIEKRTASVIVSVPEKTKPLKGKAVPTAVSMEKIKNMKFSTILPSK